jgi:pyrroloquinoline-quinone synthase
VTQQTPLDGGAFAAALRGKSTRYWDRHPFHLRMHRGGLDEHEVRAWVANRWYYQKSLPLKNAAIIANCPELEVRRRWLARIAFQDGAAGEQGGLADWLRLAEAVGLSRAEVVDERHVLPGVRFAVDAYVNFARTRPWIESAAAALTELFSPDLMRDRAEVFRRLYPWIGAEGSAYFESRIEEVANDCSYTLGLVVARCTTREQQDAALAALSFKCDVLWSILDAVEHASSCAAAERREAPGDRVSRSPAVVGASSNLVRTTLEAV